VALAIETNLQLNLSLNSILFYIALFCGTVLFYTYAYIEEKNLAFVKRNIHQTLNKRSKWYYDNRLLIKKTQAMHFILCSSISLYFFIHYFHRLHLITLLQIAGLASTGFIALAYYGISLGSSIRINTRSTGWLKPFVIGLVWATAVTYVPLLWHQVEQDVHYKFSHVDVWFFIKNFMYISLLAILFDIKDYAADHNRKLKTFVVRYGLQKTIFFIIIPLTILGFLALIAFAVIMHFPPLRILINSIPFVLLVIVAWSMQRRKSILYYLAVIDGLMFLKALCGITAYLFAK
jgi:4-hydroxybenzoate polyprenyltransferase